METVTVMEPGAPGSPLPAPVPLSGTRTSPTTSPVVLSTIKYTPDGVVETYETVTTKSASTPAYPAAPASVSGGWGKARMEHVVSSHPPPSAWAPTRPVAAAMSAPLARARPATKAAPTGPAAVWQLHSLRSPDAASDWPIAARFSASSANVSADQPPAVKLTWPGAPWAMTWTASRP